MKGYERMMGCERFPQVFLLKRSHVGKTGKTIHNQSTLHARKPVKRTTHKQEPTAPAIEEFSREDGAETDTQSLILSL